MTIAPPIDAGIGSYHAPKRCLAIHARRCVGTLALLLCAFGGLPGSIAPASAESLAASASSAGSSASSAGSASSRGSSDSIQASGNSSRRDGKVAEGDYRIAAVAALDGRPGMLRLTAQPLAGSAAAHGFELHLPQRALGERPLVPGDVISAQHRPYGLAFARGDTREAFFLVLADDWQHDLKTRALAD